MSDTDIRWLQRFQNYSKALAQQNEAIELMQQRELSKFESQGVIQGFKCCYKLAWNLLRGYLQWQGTTGLTGSRDSIREAFSSGLIEDGEQWINMLQGRNRTSHTYNQDTATATIHNIQHQYHLLFLQLRKKIDSEVKRHELG